MALWQKLWLLFAVIWVVVAALNAATILAFSESDKGFEQALLPAGLAIVVPAAAYLLFWTWFRLRRKNK